MSHEVLRSLVQQRAFNATPRLDDLSALHVTFESMVGTLSAMSRAVLRAERGAGSGWR